jgi:hypothetical protein
MSDDMEIIHGSGNVFRDLGQPDADREQLRALLAAKIIGVLDDRKLTVRAAHEVTGIAAADFSHPQGQSRPLHDRPSDDDPVQPRAGGRSIGQNPSAAHRHGD